MDGEEAGHTSPNISLLYEVGAMDARVLRLPDECPTCDGLAPDRQRPSYDRKSFHKKSYHVRLPVIVNSVKKGCHGCFLLCRAALAIKPNWDGLNDEDVVFDWRSPNATDGLQVWVYTQPLGQPATTTLVDMEIFGGPGECTLWHGIPSIFPEHSGSKMALRKLSDWVENCRLHHKECVQKDAPSLPDRLVEVQSSSGSKELRLIESKGSTGRYAALSHCWGTQEGATPPITLMKDSLESWKISLPWGSFSKTFQDAVLITRALGLRFLWIDSLCIIQDDAADWREQSSQMSSVYTNTALTIASTRASDGSVGCFSLRPTAKRIALLEEPQGCSRTIDVYVRQAFSHTPYLLRDIGHLYEEKDDFPLFQRAWCFQERLLSPRVIHYGKHEMVWQCRESIACECREGRWMNVQGWPAEGQKMPIFRTLYFEALDSQDFGLMQSLWRCIVMEYSATRLTKSEDILPALSGLAQQIHLFGLGNYVSGLWERDLGFWLNWYSNEPRQRPLFYTAPSFSWASRIGQVQWYMDEEHSRSEYSLLIEILTIHCGTSDAYPFGQVLAAFIKVRGCLISATFLPATFEASGNCMRHWSFPYSIVVKVSDEDLRQSYMDTWKESDGWWKPYMDTLEAANIQCIKLVYCLPLLHFRGYRRKDIPTSDTVYIAFTALILERVTAQQYRRIGIIMNEHAPKRWIEGQPKQEFSII